MATIIDNTYFKNGWLFIPNNKDINASPVGSPTIETDLDLFRIEYERELLLNSLGVTLYNLLQTALLDLPSSDQKWQDLVEGKDYAINGKTKRWNGLRGANQQSLIAFYVYCQYLRNDNSTYLTTGIAQSTANNAERSDPSPKFVKSWNRFLKQYQGDYTYSSPTVIYNRSGMIGLDYYGYDNVEINLFQYLTDQNELTPTDFPDFEFKFYESYNTFGI